MASRERLGFRVDAEVLERFKQNIEGKHGQIRPYGGITLEREIQAAIGEGQIGELIAAVGNLQEVFPEATEREKNSIATNPSGDTKPVQLRVDPDVKDAADRHASNHEFRSTGKFIENLMGTFNFHGPVEERLSGKLNDVRDVAEEQHEESELNAVEKRRQNVIDQVTPGSFTIEDFDNAINSCSGISATPHARQEHLPAVLDEIGYTWHPKNPDVFIPFDRDCVPEVRDPRKKPRYLADEGDMKLAIKTDALKEAAKASARGVDMIYYSVKEAAAAVPGNRRQSTVRPLMKKIDGESGFRWKADRDAMRVKGKEIDDREAKLVVEEHDLKPAEEKRSRDSRRSEVVA